jgi:lysozyme
MAQKTNQIFLRFSILMLVFIGGLMAYFLWRQYQMSKSSYSHSDDADNNFSRYPGYGIWMPNDFEVHGIDVSRFQKQINWPLVRKMRDGNIAIKFAFIKATEGSNFVDQQFARNWKKCRENNLARGAYHFFSTTSSGHEQALHFINHVKLLPGDLPPVLDIEKLNGQDVDEFLNEIEIWLKVIENHYKVTPIIYSNAAFYNKYLNFRFGKYPLWVAHYQNRKRPAVEKEWQFWQHNEGGRVNGINAFVDFNVFNGTDSAFQKMLVPD